MFSNIPLFAQGFTATVSGTVTDSSGAALPGASVTVTNLGTGQTQILKADSSGRYEALLLPPGNYRVEADMPGFKQVVRQPVMLQVDQRQQLDFPMDPGQVGQSVTVTADASQVQTENATVGTAVTREQTAELPLNGRSFLQLDLLIPGAQSTVSGSNLSGEGGSIEVHGMREDSNYFWVDGMDNTTQAIGEYVVNVPPFTIEEFRVMSPTYDAEFGRTAGAQINVITRSGSNAFHGDAYEFIRNSALDAKNYFDPAGKIPAFRRHQFGGDLGGKIKQDRSFFYGAWEGIRQAQGESASNSVPTASEVQGDFSGSSITLTDPQTQLPFVNDIIPSNRINPIGAAIAAYYPTSPTGIYNVSPIGTNSDDVSIAKLDQIISEKNRLSLRAAFEDINYTEPISQYSNTTNIPGFGLDESANHNYTVGLSDTHTFTPSLVGEVRVGWNRFEYHYQQEDSKTNQEAALGLPGVNTADSKDWGLPQVQLAGLYSNLGPPTNFPQYGPFDTTFVAPTFTWARKKHTFKFGGDYHIFDTVFALDLNVRGTLSFSGQYSGNPLADLLLGLPNQASIGTFLYNNSQFLFRAREFSGFAQDDWRISPRLTLTLGMRYEYNIPAIERENRMSNFNAATGALVVAGQNGVGSQLYNADPYEYQPRIGFSWQPNANGKLVLRGGYGIFNELTQINQVLGLRLNVPFYTNESVLGDGATITLDNVFNNATGAAYPNLSAFAQNYKAGRVQQYSLGVQQQLAQNLVLDVGYVGTRGSSLYGTVNQNQPAPAPGLVQTRRPFPEYSSISAVEPVFSSNYSALEARLEKRLSNGMQFLTSYTWSHSLDDSSGSGGYNSLQNSSDLQGNRGSSSFDVRQHVVFSYVYVLPFLQSRSDLLGKTLGGWQLNGILQVHSGNPFTPVLAFDNSNTGQYADRPNLVGNPNQSSPTCQVHTANCWVNPAAFAVPAPYTFGNAARNSLAGPGFRQLDFALAKNLALREKGHLEFRAEAFNIFNNVNFNTPTNTLGATFGHIYTAGGNAVGLFGSRQIQFGLRLVF
jgi:hypothetical protein